MPAGQVNRSLFYLIKSLVVLCAFFIVHLANAQEGSECPTKNRKAAKLFDEAMQKLYSGNEKDAYPMLIQCIEMDQDFADAYYSLALIKQKSAIDAGNKISTLKKSSQDFNLAEEYFRKSIEICPELDDYSAYFYLGQMFYSKYDFFNAMQFIEIYIEKSKKNKSRKKEAAEMYETMKKYYELIENPVDFHPKVVPGVCTKKDEYLPMISPDGVFAFYTQRWMDKTQFSDIEKYFENFTVSERISEPKDKNLVFTEGKPMPEPFNDGRNQGGVTITIDNRYLYITICDQVKVKEFGGKEVITDNCDIYVSELINGKWTDPVNLGPNINGRDTWESQPSISSDGKTLYFSSIRPENIGFSYPENITCDLWYSVKDEQGKWGKAINMGPQINTSGNEKAPFMHSDSRTLYFSSDGWLTIGGYDIFHSKVDKNGLWSEPENIGYPINNEYDNLGLVVSTFGNHAFFTSREFKGVGGLDIFSFELPKEARPDKVLFVKGDISTKDGEDLTGARVQLKGTISNNVSEAIIDEKTGKFAVAVTVDSLAREDYVMIVKKEDYAFTSSYIALNDEITEAPVVQDFELKKIEIGQPVEIRDIHFETDSWIFDLASIEILESFAEFLLENPSLKIEIHGHTDNMGDAAHNKELSEKRAKSVRSFLLLLGIEMERMPSCIGWGEDKPLANNNTEEGRAKNRRTEFVIINK